MAHFVNKTATLSFAKEPTSRERDGFLFFTPTHPFAPASWHVATFGGRQCKGVTKYARYHTMMDAGNVPAADAILEAESEFVASKLWRTFQKENKVDEDDMAKHTEMGLVKALKNKLNYESVKALMQTANSGVKHLVFVDKVGRHNFHI